ncbi:MAG: MBL fold metallo-hydrolase [Candidatus Lokiarchaeota archaeon]
MICRFLGNACLEIVSVNNHFIVDPNYLEPPKKGIGKVFLTHEHDDHTDAEKIKRIHDLYIREDKDFQLFGPTSVKDKVPIEPILVENGTKIELKDGSVEVFEIECWKSEKCLAYLIEIDDKRILHTADSAKYSNHNSISFWERR